MVEKDQNDGKVRLSARVISVPKSVSTEARAALSRFARDEPAPPTPPVTDKEAWRDMIRQANDGFAPLMWERVSSLGARSVTRIMAGVTVYEIEPPVIPEGNAGKAMIFFHGGGLVLMAGDCTRYFGMMEAVKFRCRVFAVDYRNPPEHPYPAALDDGVAVYRELLVTHAPSDIVITGVSGGGNLAVTVPLKARDTGLPFPAAVGLFTPEVDLTESGDTFQTNRDIDVRMRGPIPDHVALYADGADLNDPYLSPIFADFSAGFPSTFIQTGTRDILLSNSVRMHRTLRRAGVEAELHVGEAMPHSGFTDFKGISEDVPEDVELQKEFIQFLAKTAGWAPF